MHVGITGGRFGPSKAQADWLRAQFTYLSALDSVVIHHGDCVGVDAYAHDLAQEFHFDIHIHPPIKLQWRAICKDATYMEKPKNYLERNRDIVDACEQVIALPGQNDGRPQSGTYYTINYANKMSTPVAVCTWIGAIL